MTLIPPPYGTSGQKPGPHPALALLLTIVLTVGLSLTAAVTRGQSLPDLPPLDLSGYEVYSPTGTTAPKTSALFRETARNALNDSGLAGLFVAETAERLPVRRMLLAFRTDYRELTSRRGKAYKTNEKGSVLSGQASVNYFGDWAEWAVTVPVHRWDLSAPRTYPPRAEESEGVGNMKIGWKATYLPDRSYYRFAYGAVAEVTTGNPDTMLPAGSKNSDELKLFGCVSTNETDRAMGNLELGAILNSEGDDHRFIYRFGLTYEASAHASLVGEIVGEVMSGEDHDTMDLIMGIRLSPTPASVLEFAYTKNLRTYREYGWDERLQGGVTIKW